jgi:hypothetical protein
MLIRGRWWTISGIREDGWMGPLAGVAAVFEGCFGAGVARAPEFAIIRLPPERWMSGLSRTPGKRV